MDDLKPHCLSLWTHESCAVFHHLTVRPVNLMTLILGKFVRFCRGMRENLGCVFEIYEVVLKAVLKQTTHSRSADLYF